MTPEQSERIRDFENEANLPESKLGIDDYKKGSLIAIILLAVFTLILQLYLS